MLFRRSCKGGTEEYWSGRDDWVARAEKTWAGNDLRLRKVIYLTDSLVPLRCSPWLLFILFCTIHLADCFSDRTNFMPLPFPLPASYPHSYAVRLSNARVHQWLHSFIPLRWYTLNQPPFTWISTAMLDKTVCLLLILMLSDFLMQEFTRGFILSSPFAVTLRNRSLCLNSRCHARQNPLPGLFLCCPTV